MNTPDVIAILQSHLFPVILIFIVACNDHDHVPGPLFNQVTNFLPPNLVKSRRREFGCYNDRIALKFDRRFGSSAAEGPVKFRSDLKTLNPNVAASRLHKILR